MLIVRGSRLETGERGSYLCSRENSREEPAPDPCSECGMTLMGVAVNEAVVNSGALQYVRFGAFYSSVTAVDNLMLPLIGELWDAPPDKAEAGRLRVPYTMDLE